MFESKTQKLVQANQTLSACDNADELSDNELATVNGGAGLLGGLLGGGGGLLGGVIGGPGDPTVTVSGNSSTSL